MNDWINYEAIMVNYPKQPEVKMRFDDLEKNKFEGKQGREFDLQFI
jgi:hypothetical protein